MKTHRFLVFLGVAAMSAVAPPLMADYPIASHRYLADPSSLVTKDRVYIYCSNDDESRVEGGYNIPNVICVSSSDMKNWTDHGSVFRAADSTTWAKKTWAPAAIERDGRFFLYFGNGGANIGDWVRLVGVDFGNKGAKKFSATVASAGQGGNMELRLRGLDGTLIGTCKVENTGGQQTWQTATCEVADATGVQDLYVTFTGGEGALFNAYYWNFE